MTYYFLFDEKGNQKTYTQDNIKGLEDMGKWLKYDSIFNPEKDLAKLVNNDIVIEKYGNVLLKELLLEKRKKIKELDKVYNESKKITIKNGNTLIIDYNSQYRKYFKYILEKYIFNIWPSDLISKDVVMFFNDEFQINMIPFFWNRLFHECFKKPTPTGLKEYIFPFNKEKYTVYKQKIEEAKTKQDLDDINYEFHNPEGIFVDINIEAEKIVSDESLKTREDYSFLMAILESARGDDGIIHLINTRFN